MLKEVKSSKNAFNRDNTNGNLRMNCYKKYKVHKKLTKNKRRKFKENLANMLDQGIGNDPQKAWKVIDELK